MRRHGESSSLEVRLFGGPAVLSVSGAVRLSPHQQALIALVYGGGPKGLSRPRVIRLLWGADPDSKQRHRLRQLLVDTRARVGRALIETASDDLRPGPGVRCDLADFLTAVDAGSLLEAASLAILGFASGRRGSVSDQFDDWRASREAGLLRTLRVRASLRWDEAFGRGEWTAAQDAAEALHMLFPEDPQAVERVIEARGRVGRAHDAEAAFATYVARLAPGEEPSPGIVATIGRVREASAAEIAPRQDSDDRVPFIGRGAALAEARSAFDAIEGGAFSFTLISGEAGIGKTRMLRELRRDAAFRGIRCLTAQPVELERRIPLNPLLDALSEVDLGPHLRALGRPWDAVIGRVLPAGVVDPPTDDLPQIQESALSRRLLDAFLLLFARLAREQPTLFLLDDLQWADATTLATLQFIQRRWTQGPLGVVATVRSLPASPRDPVSKYLCGTDGLSVTRVELGELSHAEAIELVRHVGRDAVDEGVSDRICALAGLHPLYLTELTRDYMAGRLRFPETPADEVMIPMSLKQILDSRVEEVSDTSMKVAGLLAVGSRPMRLTDLARLAGLTLDATAEAVEELRHSRLVQVERDRVRIVHELFRAAIYAYLGEPRRAVYHGALAAHMLSDGSHPADGELALHFARAGERDQAAEFGRAAAERAMTSGAVAEAAHFYRLVSENEQDCAKRATATAGLARALHLTRDIERANPILELAANRLREAGLRTPALRMEITRVEGLAEMGDTPIRELLERLEAIKREARASHDWEAVALALDVELHLLSHDEDVGGVRRLFDELRQVADTDNEAGRALAHAGLALGVFFDDPEEAFRSATEAVQMTAHGARQYRFRALNRLVIVLYHRGLLQQPSSHPIVTEAWELAKRSGDRLQRYSLESNLAAEAMDAGDLDRAGIMLQKAGELLGSADMTFPRINHACNLGELALSTQDFEAAGAAFMQADRHLGPSKPRYTVDFVNAGLGLCALETGALSEARRREQHLNDLRDTWHYDPTLIVAFRTKILARRGCSDEALELLAWTAEDLEGRLVLAWLKVRALQVRLLLKRGSIEAMSLAEDALAKAEALSLVHRAREFRRLLDLGTARLRSG